VDRAQYFLVHTPQCFDAKTIKNAYLQGFNPRFTDDASVVEAIGVCPLLVLSNEENIKITSPIDLKILSAIL
jgi:2-C-methyl-D-erythritol 4-phosphate cytidylyltransferase